MEDKFLDFQFESVFGKRSHPSYSDRSDQDEVDIQHDRLRSQEWCNCKNFGNIASRLEFVCCHEIPRVKALHLKGKTGLSDIAAKEFLARISEIICEGNHFLLEFSSEIF